MKIRFSLCCKLFLRKVVQKFLDIYKESMLFVNVGFKNWPGTKKHLPKVLISFHFPLEVTAGDYITDISHPKTYSVMTDSLLS